jgi:cytokinesis protein
VRRGLTDLREGHKRIKAELEEHFAEIDPNDRYAKQMWSFVGRAGSQIADLTDDVNAVDTHFTEVVRFYGEDEKSMNSSEFYGVFKTFVTSYKVLFTVRCPTRY